MPPPNGTPPARKRSPTSGALPATNEPSALVAPKRTASSGTLRSAGAPAKLVCNAGPKAGTEFVLNEEEIVIGRATEVQVSVPDTSVSRRHLAIRRVTGGWSVLDLGSGNGTQLNGESITEETRLHSGDTVTCGDTEFTFMDLENATDRRPLPVRRPSLADIPVRRSSVMNRPDARPRVIRSGIKQQDPGAQKRRKRIVLYGGAFFFVCIVALVGLKLSKQVGAKRAAQQAAILAKRQQEIAALSQEAKNLVRVGKWKDARVKFEEVKRLDPNFPAVDDYLKKSDIEIPNEEALNAADEAIKSGRVAEASALLAKVRSDTQQFKQLGQLKAQLAEKQIARLTEAQELRIQALKSSTRQDHSKWDQILGISGDVLAAYPDNRDAKVLNDEAKQAVAVLTAPEAVRVVAPSRPWEGAINLFVDGDITGAFSVANACAAKYPRCKALIGEMTDFQNLYKKLEDLDGKGLTQLLTLDQKITEGRTSKMARTAGTRAAGIWYRSAAAAKTAGAWGRELEYAAKALKADPNHAAAQAMIVELRTRARDIYMSGYAIKDTDPEGAIAKFKEVTSMTPPDDEFHQKAKHRVEEMQK